MANIKEAKQLVKDWTGKGDEKQDTQRFWIQLLDKVYEDHNYNDHILFEQTADKMEGGKYFKDVIINRYTDHAVLIEQKGMKYALDQKEPRHGLMLTPFEQAKEYDDKSGANDKARWIITCNFQEFWIYDNYKTGKELYQPVAKINLTDLPKRLDKLAMIGQEKRTIDFTEEVDVSVQAGDLVGILYNELHKNYHDPDSLETLKQLNILCVRIVFCLYAEDAGLFNKSNRKMFHDYLAQFDARGMRRALSDLFKVLNQKEEERDPYLADDNPTLAAFPYVNGGLFEGDVVIPPFTDETVDILLNKESLGFDWSKISPTIFGAVFESTLNQQTRRSGGMHYTSLENIHKVIDPLFLDDLTKELYSILALKTANTRNRRLREYQDKLSQIRCFDPACGSGNFLTESYLSLRRLENSALKARLGQNISLGFQEEGLNPIKVSIQQFYGIEINDFAVSVAKTALWIAEAQMFEETQSILNSDKEFLPLETFSNIHEGNALKMDWNAVIDRKTEHLYIMGNPPFVGYSLQTQQQKSDLHPLYNNVGNIDYVAGWYMKAAQYIYGTNIPVCFVSTNSITQGEQVSAVWKPLLSNYNVHINYAYRTFQWDSEAHIKAHVHVVVVGFSTNDNHRKKLLFDENAVKHVVDFISPYLIDAPIIWVNGRSKPICNVPEMSKGSQATDGGNLLFKNIQEVDDFLEKEPAARPYIKKFIGSEELINNKTRYCLWLKGVSPSIISGMPEVVKRIEAVRTFRLSSKKKATRNWADRPALFTEDRQPSSDYLMIPRVSSEKRKYIPLGYLSKDVIASDSSICLPNADLYLFGVLSSNVHMAWMRTVAGRLKSDYRYSNTLVYNTFPFPELTNEQKLKIEKTAKAIIDARALYPDTSMASMYGDKMYLYFDLVKAHEANDNAVMDAYGFDKNMSEPEIVSELMKIYQRLTSDNLTE